MCTKSAQGRYTGDLREITAWLVTKFLRQGEEKQALIASEWQERLTFYGVEAKHMRC